jgi:Uma2 family endonuclease
MSTAQQTHDDSWEGEEPRTEIINGVVVVSPPTSGEHGHIQVALSIDIGQPFGRGRGGPGGWWILSEVDVLLLPPNRVRPDLAGWRKERMPIVPRSGSITVVPDWVCEILSPSNARFDRLTKMEFYLRAGVPYCWLVDPDAQMIEAYSAHEGLWLRQGAWGPGDKARIPPFDAVELDLGLLFPGTDTP